MVQDRRSVTVDKLPSVLHSLRVGKNMDLGAWMWDRGPGPAVLASAAAVTMLTGIITNILVSNNIQGSSASFTMLATGTGLLVVAISNMVAGKVSRRQSFENRLRLHEAAAMSRISALLSSTVEHQCLRLPTIDLSIEVKQSSGIDDAADLDVSSGEGLALESSALITLLAEHPRCTIILGGPGSGKTTVLLKLANRVIRSRQPEQFSCVPLLLSCRTWDNSAFSSWLDDQARSSFGVAGPVLRSWTNKGSLLLLLDGIDEVKPDLQISFVSELNAWLGSSVGGKAVITCRTGAYFSFAQKVWHDQLAIMHPLTPNQVKTYLQRLSENSQVAAIRTGLGKLSNALTHQLNLGEEWRSPRLVRMVAEVLSLEQSDNQSLDHGAADPAAVAVKLGDRLLLEGDLDGALKTYQVATETAPSTWHSSADMRIGLLLASSGDVGAAQNLIQRLLSADLDESVSQRSEQLELTAEEGRVLAILANGDALDSARISSKALLAPGVCNTALRSLRDRGLIEVIDDPRGVLRFRQLPVEFAA